MPLTARQKAQAAEALIRHPDLTPAARRVGLELLNLADRRTGISWPSEARMAEALGVDPRTIRRGKADLRAAGLLTWEQRGHHRTPIYRLLWDRLVQLATTIKAKVQAACKAARASITPPTTTTTPTTDNKPSETGAAQSSGRTFSPAYLTQQFKKRAGEGRQGPNFSIRAPQRQILTDQQLDAKAATRFWTALQALGSHITVQFISHPCADEFQTKAIRAERFKPDHGRTGIAMLHQLLQASTS